MATGIPRQIGIEPDWDLEITEERQGHYTVEEYLEMTSSTNKLVEFDNGRIEVLEMPNLRHQYSARSLFRALDRFVTEHDLGEVLFAPLRIYTLPEKFREPDIMVVLNESQHEGNDEYLFGADLVVEVVSPDPQGRKRDLDLKPEEYAAAQIPEYWIVDPKKEQITVFHLDGDDYQALGVFGRGERANSKLLAGFSVDVAAVFTSGGSKSLDQREHGAP